MYLIFLVSFLVRYFEQIAKRLKDFIITTFVDTAFCGVLQIKCELNLLFSCETCSNEQVNVEFHAR